MPSLNLGAMSAVPRELVPSAAGTLNFIRMTGAAIGVNALAIVIDSRIATHLQSFVAPQTAGHVRLAELTAMLSGQLATLGVPDSERDGPAPHPTGRLPVLTAN